MSKTNTIPTAQTAPENPKEKGLGAMTGSLSFDPTDPEILWILGRPCFVCGPIAHILQAAGHDIPKKAENEQAAVMIWMIQKYQQHGENWKAKADEDLVAIRAASKENGGAVEPEEQS